MCFILTNGYGIIKIITNNKTNMKKLLLFLIITLSIVGATAEEINDQKLVSELTVNELKEIVKVIVEETIEKCVVTGTMEGRAKVNLKVEGEVLARMECEFKNENAIKKNNL